MSETRLSFTRLRVFDLPLSAFGTNVLADLGIQGFANDPFTFGLPALIVTDFDTVQDSNTLPQLQRDNTWYLSSRLLAHRRAGTPGRPAFSSRISPWRTCKASSCAGSFIFNGAFTQDPANPDTTGDAFADFLLGFPDQTQRDVGTARPICGRTATRATCRTTGASRRGSA